ncbi:glycosyltransferase family protein [Futiania mangrovi]|uniref:Glycosyltransferase subfamily 4-like N-terminal domain-containing protein n=1 Tax=Futiania mangrovi TaxID=2959716 RepID=A0A9J6PJK4_9PROT|nr:hypothetical protein [Futiania mangrovii]MCP1336258.1 hypothetical protein [Futiania mangrovii]
MQRPLKILFVAGFFPPYAPPGAVRNPKLAQYLAEAGHDLQVLSILEAKHEGLHDAVLPEGRVHPLPYAEPGAVVTRAVGRARQLAASTVTQGGGAGATEAVGGGPSRGNGPSPLKLLYRQAIALPDRYRSWVRVAEKRGRALARTWHPDVILSSGPPQSAHIAAARLSKALARPWVAELRDLWANNPYVDVHPLLRGVFEAKARATLSHASAMVALTKTAQAELQATYDVPVLLAMNGYDPADFEGLQTITRPVGDAGRLTIIHAGVIYPGRRDPRALFEAITRLGADKARVRVRFFHDELDFVGRLARDLEVEECVEIRAAVPRKDILRIERESDVLLLCRWANPADDGVIPGKVFEYIGARRPILSIGSTSGEAADIVRAGPFGLVSNDPDEIAAQLHAWLDQIDAEGRIPDLPADAAHPFERAAQFRKIGSLLDAVVRG